MIENLNFLLGSWKGEGHAAYPTIESADYLEELTIEPLDSTTITFLQKTWRKKDNSVLHWESSFILGKEPDTFTFINSQNNGRTEVMKGTLESPEKFICDSVYFSNDERPVRTRREYFLEDDALQYKLYLQTQNQPFQLHLEAKLKKS
ncbi:MAG: FABP family protein [Bacteroidetes bacterium]|nr:FABP family protein [Bacteroidota bacterium]